MDKYKNKYRIPSARLQNWNYGSPGLYFVTICTKDRIHYFDEMENDEMVLNELGLIVNDEWIKTLTIRPDMNLEFGEFITMPNHFHGIIMIGENVYNTQEDSLRRDAMHGVSTDYNTKINDQTNQGSPNKNVANKFGPQSKNLGSIIRGFKSSVSTQVKKLNIDFGWQERFHDHIIRNHDEFIRISEYILNNAANWRDDKFFN